MELTDIIGLAGVPIVAALVQAFKLWYPEEPRVYPLVAIAFGLAINLAVAWTSVTDLRVAAVYGLVAGLAASGLYSGGKALAGGAAREG